MRTTICRGMATFLGLSATLLAGCSAGPKEITGDLQGRRAQAFDVDGDWMAYAWTPTALNSTQTHLVARNLRTGEETEFESDLTVGCLAVSDARIVYVRRTRGGESSIVVYDTLDGTKKTIAETSAQSLDISGESVVWETNHDRGSTVMIHDLTRGRTRDLSGYAGTPGVYGRNPRIDVGTVAWVHKEQGKSRIVIHDLYAGTSTPTSITSPNRIHFDLSGDYLVYRALSAGVQTISLYHIPTGTDTELATGDRFMGPPQIGGDTVAWIDHIPREEFKPMGGHPLIDERDFRNIYRYDIRGRRTRQIASSLFAGNSVAVCPAGRVYATAQRGLHPARESNLLTPVDVLSF